MPPAAKHVYQVTMLDTTPTLSVFCSSLSRIARWLNAHVIAQDDRKLNPSHLYKVADGRTRFGVHKFATVTRHPLGYTPPPVPPAGASTVWLDGP